jgi:hypothetical protein
MRKTLVRFRAAILGALVLGGALALSSREARADCPFTPTNDVVKDMEEGARLLYSGKLKLFNVYWGDDWDANNPGFSRDSIERAMNAVLDTPYFDRLCQYGVEGFEFDGSAGSSGICNSDPGSITSIPKIFDFMSCEEYTPFTGVPTAVGAPNPVACHACGFVPADCFNILEPFCTLTPNATGSRIYVVFLPRGTQIEDFGRFSCKDYDALHFQIPSRALFFFLPPFVILGSQGRPLNLAIIPTACFHSVDEMMESVTHEIVEAATDPLPLAHWLDDSQGTRGGRIDLSHVEELLKEGEVADLCEPGFVHYTAPDGTQARVANYWSNHENQCLSLDGTPPVTTASTVPPAADWVNTNVVVTLAATDSGPLASGVKEVVFSASGAQVIAENQVAGANASLTISSEGITNVFFHAVDNMGNVEPTRTLTVRIDKTPPVVRYTGNLGTYTIDQTIDITCSATDALSGIRSTTCADIHRPAFELPLGSNTFSASAVDLAGNSASASVTFTIQVTEGSLCNLTRRFTTKPQIADSLCAKLDAARQAPTPQARAGQLRAFLHELDAQTGKAFSRADAAILAKLGQALLAADAAHARGARALRTAGDPECTLPSCLARLNALCEPAGACVQQTTPGGTHICYANGVKLLSSFGAGAGSSVSHTRVTKPDGSACYEVEGRLAGTGAPPSFTYTDAGGALLATATYDGTAMALTVTCTGEAPVEVPLRCATTGGPVSATLCTSGSCD